MRHTLVPFIFLMAACSQPPSDATAILEAGERIRLMIGNDARIDGAGVVRDDDGERVVCLRGWGQASRTGGYAEFMAAYYPESGRSGIEWRPDDMTDPNSITQKCLRWVDEAHPDQP